MCVCLLVYKLPWVESDKQFVLFVSVKIILKTFENKNKQTKRLNP